MRLPPPILALSAAVAQRALTSDAPRPTAARKALSGVTAASSAALMGSAMQRFRGSGTTVDPLRPERATALVASGPFALTRNPMYVGMAGLLAAHAAYRGAWPAVVPLAGFVVLMDRTQIAAEEQALVALFGEEYDAYRQAVPRWLGTVSVPTGR